jgi:hypothetical protein
MLAVRREYDLLGFIPRLHCVAGLQAVELFSFFLVRHTYFAGMTKYTKQGLTSF